VAELPGAIRPNARSLRHYTKVARYFGIYRRIHSATACLEPDLQAIDRSNTTAGQIVQSVFFSKHDNIDDTIVSWTCVDNSDLFQLVFLVLRVLRSELIGRGFHLHSPSGALVGIDSLLESAKE
jgi:hypothetical protein